jgi:hypothetical protein
MRRDTLPCHFALAKVCESECLLVLNSATTAPVNAMALRACEVMACVTSGCLSLFHLLVLSHSPLRVCVSLTLRAPHLSCTHNARGRVARAVDDGGHGRPVNRGGLGGRGGFILTETTNKTTRIDVGRQAQLSCMFCKHIAILYIAVASRWGRWIESRAVSPLAAEEEEEEGLKQRATWTLSATARRRRRRRREECEWTWACGVLPHEILYHARVC